MESGEEMRKNLQLKVQILFTILTNGYAYGFLNGKIYQGTLKYACVPGLNCYSCPGALGACPIGAMQAVEGSTKYGISMNAILQKRKKYAI